MGNRQPTPSCDACCHYGENILASATSDEEALPREDHGIAAGTCWHPSSLITRGTGSHYPAVDNRQTLCDVYARFFSAERDTRRLVRRTVRINRIGDLRPIGTSHQAEVSVPANPELGTAVVHLPARIVEQLDIGTGTVIEARMH